MLERSLLRVLLDAHEQKHTFTFIHLSDTFYTKRLTIAIYVRGLTLLESLYFTVNLFKLITFFFIYNKLHVHNTTVLYIYNLI